MLDHIPTKEELNSLLGPALQDVWEKLCALVESSYEMERLWNSGGRAWVYEYKYRRGGKTLCTLYAREGCIGFLLVFGKAEREKVEALGAKLSEAAWKAYEEATTYHDGKWVLYKPADTSLFEDFLLLMGIKRRPNRK